MCLRPPGIGSRYDWTEIDEKSRSDKVSRQGSKLLAEAVNGLFLTSLMTSRFGASAPRRLPYSNFSRLTCTSSKRSGPDAVRLFALRRSLCDVHFNDS